MATDLSPRQERVLGFIRSFLTKRGFPPSIRDIVSGCGISSTSVANYNLHVLQKKGYIRRHPEVSRGIELLAWSPTQRTVQVPVIGQIAAGEPISVPGADTWNTTPSEVIEVTEDLTRGRKRVYALRVKGVSMIDALINDGDTVLMQYVKTVENGEMAAVWLKNEKEVTLKRVYSEPDGRVRLQPANQTMKPVYTRPDNIEIQGRVIGVIRRLV